MESAYRSWISSPQIFAVQRVWPANRKVLGFPGGIGRSESPSRSFERDPSGDIARAAPLVFAILQAKDRNRLATLVLRPLILTLPVWMVPLPGWDA